VEYIKANPQTLLLTAADSEAGGMQLVAVRDTSQFNLPLPEKTDNGAPLDGIDGTRSLPFTAAPDKNGVKLRFGVAWACYGDVAGGVISRAHGLNSSILGLNVDNTDIYRIMYATLFGRLLPAYR
jgi:alkaline phosphatase